jgi:microcystin-dependent protein
MWCDGNNNVYVTKPDGTNQYLGPPPGTIMYTAANSADVGWALCNGQTVPKAANPALWARIGNAFGGDANNIGLPDIRGRVVAHVDGGAGRLVNVISGVYGSGGGSDIHTLTIGEMASHGHGLTGLSLTANATGQWLHSHPLNVAGGHSVLIVDGGSGGSSQFYGGNLLIRNLTDITSIGSTDLNHGHSVSISGSIDSTGSNTPHGIVQPTIVLNAQIKLG